MSGRLFTSESVTEGHPDKIADQISDAILDEMLRQDPRSRVAVETLITTGQVHIAGEVTTAGYVDDDDIERQGAGDQGLMFGYATDETPELMPLPIALAHRLSRRLSAVRKDGSVPYLRPDGKTQVTVVYEDDRPVGVDTVVVSSQHAEDISIEQLLTPDVQELVVEPELAALGLPTDGYRLLVNPTGKFVIGGPVGDAGLTRRQIIVDPYGGMARHGGGAFPGKDPSKVDRSGAYAMRGVAKNVVAAVLARRCEVQVAYAIGAAHPVGLFIETFGTGAVADDVLEKAIGAAFDLRPGAIVRDLDLLRPIYAPTAAYGHFGRTDVELPWERLDRVDALKSTLAV